MFLSPRIAVSRGIPCFLCKTFFNFQSQKNDILWAGQFPWEITATVYVFKRLWILLCRNMHKVFFHNSFWKSARIKVSLPRVQDFLGPTLVTKGGQSPDDSKNCQKDVRIHRQTLSLFNHLTLNLLPFTVLYSSSSAHWKDQNTSSAEEDKMRCARLQKNTWCPSVPYSHLKWLIVAFWFRRRGSFHLLHDINTSILKNQTEKWNHLTALLTSDRMTMTFICFCFGMVVIWFGNSGTHSSLRYMYCVEIWTPCSQQVSAVVSSYINSQLVEILPWPIQLHFSRMWCLGPSPLQMLLLRSAWTELHPLNRWQSPPTTCRKKEQKLGTKILLKIGQWKMQSSLLPPFGFCIGCSEDCKKGAWISKKLPLFSLWKIHCYIL